MQKHITMFTRQSKGAFELAITRSSTLTTDGGPDWDGHPDRTDNLHHVQDDLQYISVQNYKFYKRLHVPTQGYPLYIPAANRMVDVPSHFLSIPLTNSGTSWVHWC